MFSSYITEVLAPVEIPNSPLEPGPQMAAAHVEIKAPR